MRFAHSDLAVARLHPNDVLLETLCFHAQQAVEKSIKAILVLKGIDVPKTHSIEVLIDLLPLDTPRVPDLAASARLSNYAVEIRYPGMDEPVTEDEYREAVRLAESVIQWAEGLLAAS